MKRWAGTLLYHVIAFFANAGLLTGSYWLYLRATAPPSAPGDDYYNIVVLLPAILTILPATIGAWVLRRLARWFGWTRWWQWTLAGVLVGLAVIWGLGRAGLAVENARFSLAWQATKVALMNVLLLGPMMYTFQPWWLPAPALAAVALILWLAQRSFGWPVASKNQGSEDVKK
jgi:hypothetical protein